MSAMMSQQPHIEPIGKGRAQVEALLLRVDIHGVEIVFEPGNLRLLRHLRHHDRDRFLQVRAGLEDVGVSRDGQERIPFAERLTCSVDDAVEASGLGRSTIYNLMKDRQIEWAKVGARRLINVASLARFLRVQ